MSKNDYTSIYVPQELKDQLVDKAQAEGFVVRRGRNSCLAQFIKTMLREYSNLIQKDPTLSSLHRLTPELRSSILNLSQMSGAQQKRACAMLDLLFRDEDQDWI